MEFFISQALHKSLFIYIFCSFPWSYYLVCWTYAVLVYTYQRSIVDAGENHKQWCPSDGCLTFWCKIANWESSICRMATKLSFSPPCSFVLVYRALYSIHRLKNAYRWSFNQHPECDFPFLLVVWMWMTNYQVCHNKDMIFKVLNCLC